MSGTKLETKKLIDVEKIGGGSRAVPLDVAATLDVVRAELSKDNFMTPEDSFLFNKAPVDHKQEKDIKLSDLLGESGTTIYIGQHGNLKSQDGVEKYNQLTGSDKKALFDSVYIYRGLILSNDGLTRSTRGDVCTWSGLPTPTQPTVTSEKSTEYTFSEFTSSLTISGMKSGSVSVATPFADAKAEYKYSQEHSVNKKDASEHLVSRMWVRKIFLRVDRKTMTARPGFAQEVEEAVAYKTEPDSSHYAKLLEVLDDWGYYVPLEFTLGGAIYAKESTTITSFEESTKESEDFGASVEARFNGIGGGGDYKQADGKDSTKTESGKYKNTILRALGGAPVIAESDYFNWVQSLGYAINWVVIENLKLCPTVALLPKSDTITRVIKTIEKNAGLPGDHNFINLPNYRTDIQRILDPYQ
ncbi:MAC/Perforin domain-containing protein [Amycolatopsis sulphurea]|uniref:MAC/Perforin domain-containing protein n=1 Tax=Amycolatopsis sulphurea TaxID=76022 RepID=A0A2A9F787_9PSEU|nr:MAC/perforin domain-containing protein [Amycolatopsis sulphurea]PFG46392.1 MAC/Perforin domain-containing protein [Amycolatopsis sulphurea]